MRKASGTRVGGASVNTAATVDALVVGAGPVGLTMAAELTRHGLRCRLIDKSAARTDKSKALVLWPRTLELLDGAGAVEPFLAAGMRVVRATIHGNGERLAQLTLDAIASPYPYALMLAQSETERLLEEELGRLGGAIERQVELLDFRVTGDTVAARLRGADGSDESVQSAWLIGCDGAHSTVRHELGMDFAGDAIATDWILADVHLDGPLPPDELRIDWHAQGILAFFPIAPGRFRVIADSGTAVGERAHDPTLAEVQAVVDVRGPAGVRVRDPIWLAGFRINERKVAEYRAGRVFLAGDAAHIHSPAGGQGMNTGMQDAFNLAWKLALVHRGRGRADVLLDTYSRERSAVGDEVLRNAGAMTRVATLRQPTAQHVRNALLPVFASFGFVQTKMRQTLTELSIHYRQSSLSRDERRLSARTRARAGGVVAGDRAPDVALSDARSGAATTLFTLRRSPRHCLLLCVGESRSGDGREGLEAIAAAVQAAYPELIDVFVAAASDALRQRYGVSAPTGVLIRPDGYIGYYGQPIESERLLAYLSSYLV